MPVKSLEELKKIREAHIKKVKLRASGESADQTIEILVGMATCGIAAGSRDVLNAFIDLIDEKSLTDIKVIQVGCMGYCHSEPTVQVNIPGKEPIIYGNVKGDVVEIILDEHIQNGNILDNYVLIKTFNSAL
ncbi:(2Fe-2S) ferredoxin domain-containing protein [Fusibacter tunisiensis]|uniref:NADP-reducing hydrogenase subunit HndB n=1 Tax=Fusibacter tunisiensis TaxID=1008308 RepID=A0ABS2MRP8_9FIRM|nr:(2Fe-2S) ferredoxin domain-containing protein [Fusibacter tunisiensis]MBM7562040.1 NADP-reducing hydrogenase subunit HndB [Fusibacter tunisiensis]